MEDWFDATTRLIRLNLNISLLVPHSITVIIQGILFECCYSFSLFFPNSFRRISFNIFQCFNVTWGILNSFPSNLSQCTILSNNIYENEFLFENPQIFFKKESIYLRLLFDSINKRSGIDYFSKIHSDILEWNIFYKYIYFSNLISLIKTIRRNIKIFKIIYYVSINAFKLKKS